MGEENTETNDESEVSGKFAIIPNEILGILGKNVRTPAGTVEKIDGDDLVWWGFFFTFRYQGMKCYQNRNTISDRFDCDVKTVTRRTARLERLGLLTIEQRKGTSSVYTAASVEGFLAMKTREKVTPKIEGIKGDGKFDEDVTPQAEQASSADQGVNLAAGTPPVVAGQRDRVASNDDSGGNDDHHAVNPKQTANRVMAPLDDLRYWSDIGYEGMDDYGVMWGVSGDDLDNLIREHLKIREAEAEKNFKSQRAH
ncbi:hypothetical protein NG42_06040 [Winslowiella iniecta]|uniref:Uncharacterized protein n=2 Tax=Winslowiella iniecta TaxID=1560201 RepID=A0A0L7SY24_9GAMM|nr:hypothetical protein NG43_20935 [Winslowiella iniecta]KOC91394.1 hypothetical protein NG42_06040 [Winslowiella iniecta]